MEDMEDSKSSGKPCRFDSYHRHQFEGKMAEWLKAMLLKSIGPQKGLREFDSHFSRQFYGKMAEWFKATVSKTVELLFGVPGVQISFFLQFWGDG